MDEKLTIKKLCSFKTVRDFWVLCQQNVSFFWDFCFFPQLKNMAKSIKKSIKK